ncbi:MAG: hypothetical protein IT249_04285 [Chitinophagaceae bacterium]|nr:hypothetical protein [Chitinophagaceae bacterium]
MRFLFVLIALNYAALSYCQENSPIKYIKVSGGRVSFGTGDVPGYGIYIEGCGNFIKNSGYLSDHIQLGGEIYFQSGVKNPKVRNPEPLAFFNYSFRHYSLTGLNGKAIFFPFRKKLSGLNISIGAGIAYQNYSYETRAELIQYTNDLAMRMSELGYENRFLLGYTISLGYDFFLISNKLLLGARYDLVNYNNGDFNYMLGGKIGFAF